MLRHSTPNNIDMGAHIIAFTHTHKNVSQQTIEHTWTIERNASICYRGLVSRPRVYLFGILGVPFWYLWWGILCPSWVRVALPFLPAHRPACSWLDLGVGWFPDLLYSMLLHSFDPVHPSSRSPSRPRRYSHSDPPCVQWIQPGRGRRTSSVWRS